MDAIQTLNNDVKEAADKIKAIVDELATKHSAEVTIHSGAIARRVGGGTYHSVAVQAETSFISITRKASA